MKTEHLKIATIAVAGALVGMVAGSILISEHNADAQGTGTTPTTAVMTPAAATPVRSGVPAVAGSLQVTRLSDTTFVVVKDEGDAEVVTLFSTEGGLIQKKHSGRFFY